MIQRRTTNMTTDKKKPTKKPTKKTNDRFTTQPAPMVPVDVNKIKWANKPTK